jgi:hypothetical protein
MPVYVCVYAYWMHTNAPALSRLVRIRRIGIWPVLSHFTGSIQRIGIGPFFERLFAIEENEAYWRIYMCVSRDCFCEYVLCVCMHVYIHSWGHAYMRTVRTFKWYEHRQEHFSSIRLCIICVCECMLTEHSTAQHGWMKICNTTSNTLACTKAFAYSWIFCMYACCESKLQHLGKTIHIHSCRAVQRYVHT